MENTSEEMIRHCHFSDGTVVTFVGKANFEGPVVSVKFGWAVCDRRDQWNRKLGIKIARNRFERRPIESITGIDESLSFKKACLVAFTIPALRKNSDQDPVIIGTTLLTRNASEVTNYVYGDGKL